MKHWSEKNTAKSTSATAASEPETELDHLMRARMIRDDIRNGFFGLDGWLEGGGGERQVCSVLDRPATRF
jgi:hypothetical protein